MWVDKDDYEIYVEEQPRYQDELESGKASLSKPYMKFNPQDAPELPTHMEDFFNCVRSRQKPKDNEDEAFIEAVTCIMSVEAYFRKRQVFWDPERRNCVISDTISGVEHGSFYPCHFPCAFASFIPCVLTS